MKLLFFAERVNLDFFRGDSLLLKRMAEGLAEKGNEIQAICHGDSEKIKVFSPMPFWFYTKVFSFPLTSFFSFNKFISLIKKEKFDAVIIKLPVSQGLGFWFNQKPLLKSKFYSRIALELKKRKIPFFIFVEGITQKDNFVSSLMDCSKETQINLMSQSNGIISLSDLQNQILSSWNIKKEKTFFPAPADTKNYVPKKGVSKLNLSKDKINLLYLSSSCDLKDFFNLFDLIENNDCVLYVVSPFVPFDLRKEIKKRNLEGKFVFLNEIPNKELPELIPFFDAGVYLKKFDFDFANASYMMKISEYLSCGLPVLVPEMTGPLSQTENAGINFEETKKISKKQLNELSVKAREIAVKKLDLADNIELLEEFIAKNIK